MGDSACAAHNLTTDAEDSHVHRVCGRRTRGVSCNARSAAGAATDAAKRCEWAAAHKAHLGTPLIADERGSTVAVLFVDQRDNYERFCLYAPDNGVGTSGQIRSPGTMKPATGPNGIQHERAGGSCDPTTGRSVGEMFGRVGADVTKATFRFSGKPSVQAVIKDGFYVVWWSGPDWPDGIALTTKSGTTSSIQMQSGARHSC